MNNGHPFIISNSGGARSRHTTLKAITIAVRISIEARFAILLEICDPGLIWHTIVDWLDLIQYFITAEI